MILSDLPSRGDAFSVHKGINRDELVRLSCGAGGGRQGRAEAARAPEGLRTVPGFELNRRNQIRIAAGHAAKRAGGRSHEIFFSGGNRAALGGASDADLIANALFRDFGIVQGPDPRRDDQDDLEEGVQLIRSDTKNSLLRLLERSNTAGGGAAKKKRKADAKGKAGGTKRPSPPAAQAGKAAAAAPRAKRSRNDDGASTSGAAAAAAGAARPTAASAMNGIIGTPLELLTALGVDTLAVRSSSGALRSRYAEKPSLPTPQSSYESSSSPARALYVCM